VGARHALHRDHDQRRSTRRRGTGQALPDGFRQCPPFGIAHRRIEQDRRKAARLEQALARAHGLRDARQPCWPEGIEMPQRNRVTPFGDIVALPGRGLLMGNRGVLHDAERRIVRLAEGRRWIACRTEFRGRRRTIMRPGSYTELFFLDEATALAAGHRPCAECRHADYERFKSAWSSCHGGPANAEAIDRQLHRDRLKGGTTKRTYRAELAALPNGAYVALGETAWLVWDDELLAWSSDAYRHRERRPRRGRVTVLTPRTIVDTIAAGYRPAIHPSVFGYS
jgi:hypothetical protein